MVQKYWGRTHVWRDGVAELMAWSCLQAAGEGSCPHTSRAVPSRPTSKEEQPSYPCRATDCPSASQHPYHMFFSRPNFFPALQSHVISMISFEGDCPDSSSLSLHFNFPHMH